MSQFSGGVDLRVSARRQVTGGLSTPTEDLAYSIAQSITNGTGAGQALYAASKRQSLAGAPVTLDLYGGLTDGLGTTLNFATICAMVIRNRATTSGHTLTIGNAASNQFAGFLGGATQTIVLRPGGTLVLLAPNDGYTVTNGSADLLKLDPGANTFDVDYIIIGT